MKKKMRFFVFWPIFKIKIAIKTTEIDIEYLDNRSNEQNGGTPRTPSTPCQVH